MNELLNIEERNELERCEVVIKQGLQTFVEVGQALMLIRDKRLYRAEYGTFKDYCEIKWNISRRRGYELINASIVMDNVRNCTQTQPQTESQARPLTKIEPELQSEVWSETVNRHGDNITQKKVEDVVKDFKPLNDELRQAKKEPMFAAQTEAEILAKAKEIKQQKRKEKEKNFEIKKQTFEKPIKTQNTAQIIIHGDSTQVLKTLEKKSYDLLLTDPPYGMDFKSGWNDKKRIENDKITDTVNIFNNVLQKCSTLLKDDAHFYIFGNIEYINHIRPIIEKYLHLKNILIWDRNVIGMGDLKSYGKSYDIVYFGYNKTFKDLNGTRDRDVLCYNRVSPSKIEHPTEKPIELLEYLIKKSSNEGDKVLEPFAGGGSTLVACKNTNRKATGIEIDKTYYELIKSRI